MANCALLLRSLASPRSDLHTHTAAAASPATEKRRMDIIMQ